VPRSCEIAYNEISWAASIGGIDYDTPIEQAALRAFLSGRTAPLRLGQSYRDRVTSFYSYWPGKGFPIKSQPGDSEGSFRMQITFAHYDNTSINDKVLDGLIGTGTVLFDANANAIGLWDNFDFNAGKRGRIIEAGLADARYSRPISHGQ
jgi:hypothetical protein